VERNTVDRFTRLTDDQHVQYLRYQSTRRTALVAHLESLGALAASNLAARKLARLANRPLVQTLRSDRRALAMAPWVTRQAAALRRAVGARATARRLGDVASELRKNLNL
jgi:hypothetical protein